MSQRRRLTIVDMFHDWGERYFSDPEAVLLFLLLIGGLTFVVYTGKMLAPVYASIIIAYLLYGVVEFFTKRGIPKIYGVFITYSLFLTVFAACFFLLLPLIWKQMANLFFELPKMAEQAKSGYNAFITQYPQLTYAEAGGKSFTGSLVENVQGWSKSLLAVSLSTIPNVIGLLVYLVLVPLLVFFFLKDGDKILGWFSSYLPKRRSLLQKVWVEVNQQIANYIRGKALEIAIIGITTYIGLAVFSLNYAALLALLVGISVIIPYVGATVVTIPVLVVAFLQFGWSNTFLYITAVYFVIQIIDGNVLVPLLFSEALSLHPVAIILAMLIFGSVWGFWGIFFSIPLATLFKSVLYAWPVKKDLIS